MDFEHFNVKIFVDGDFSIELVKFIEVFHRWIAEQSFEEMMIDVADYRHVPAGPGVVMIGLEADYAIDNTAHRFGVRYNRKAPLKGDNQTRLCQAFDSASSFCSRLESEFAVLKFDRGHFEVFVNDRAVAPNNEETLRQLETEVSQFVRDHLGRNCEIKLDANPRKLARAEVRVG